MLYTVRPIADRTWLRGDHQRTASRFDSTWTRTLQLLGREIDHLRGRDIVLEVDVAERHTRIDGMLRADAKAATPAVVVAFETRCHGPMLYRCDRYTRGWRSSGADWQENVHAIALTLEALRAVDRYGATETGQQYTGFKAIGGGSPIPMPEGLSRMDAEERLRLYGPAGASLEDAFKRAQRKTHPDLNDGDHTAWRRVEEAAKVLGLL